MAIGVLVVFLVVGLVLTFSWGASAPPFISKGDEVTRKITESVTT
jgi:hypothetical protein